MRFTGYFNVIKFDKNLVVKQGRQLAYQEFLDAATKFLLNAAPNVPIDTGMARGSFLNLLQMLRNNSISRSVYIPTTPQRLLKSGKALTYRHYDNSTYPKTPFTATKLSTRPDDILKWVGTQLLFEYSTDVKHLNINDFKLGWLSFKRGHDAFYNSLTFKWIKKSKYVISTKVSI